MHFLKVENCMTVIVLYTFIHYFWILNSYLRLNAEAEVLLAVCVCVCVCLYACVNPKEEFWNHFREQYKIVYYPVS